MALLGQLGTVGVVEWLGHEDFLHAEHGVLEVAEHHVAATKVR